MSPTQADAYSDLIETLSEAGHTDRSFPRLTGPQLATVIAANPGIIEDAFGGMNFSDERLCEALKDGELIGREALMEALWRSLIAEARSHVQQDLFLYEPVPESQSDDLYPALVE